MEIFPQTTVTAALIEKWLNCERASLKFRHAGTSGKKFSIIESDNGKNHPVSYLNVDDTDDFTTTIHFKLCDDTENRIFVFNEKSLRGRSFRVHEIRAGATAEYEQAVPSIVTVELRNAIKTLTCEELVAFAKSLNRPVGETITFKNPKATKKDRESYELTIASVMTHYRTMITVEFCLTNSRFLHRFSMEGTGAYRATGLERLETFVELFAVNIPKP